MLVLATVGVPPVTVTAPPLMRIFPAASRLSVMGLSSSSPNTLSLPSEKDALTAMVVVSCVVPQRGLWLDCVGGCHRRLGRGQRLPMTRGRGPRARDVRNLVER